jgi:hypothetical protein
MFRFLPHNDVGIDALEALALDMLAHGGVGEDNDHLPSGYTYLGQLIDHDLTFDPVSVLQRDNDPEALIDFRTPALDLDALYGSGPDVQPYLYDFDDERDLRGVRLLVTRDDDGRTVDLARNGQGRALIGDARDDENLITSQLHLLLARFHNILVDQVRDRDGLAGNDLLAEVQRRVRWHYQWIVRHDFLPAFAGPTAAALPQRAFAPTDRPFMPVEFSAAAFRCGHSLVRARYRVRGDRIVPIFAADGEASLRGRRPVPAELRIDWSLFFGPDRRTLTPRANRAMRIDDRLAEPLKRVPPNGDALPLLNLRRGRALGLPSGQAVARAMGVDALEPEELRLDGLPRPARRALQDATPLWFYLLREAAMRGAGGQHLGPVGGRIVAEVLLGLLEADPESYVRRDPAWTPDAELARDDGTFLMHDLITFVEAHDP